MIEPIKSWPGCSCECYPECRNDCPDWRTCYERLPEYWDAQHRAKKLAESVRAQKPWTIGARWFRTLGKIKPVDQRRYERSGGQWWDARKRVWKLPYSE